MVISSRLLPSTDRPYSEGCPQPRGTFASAYAAHRIGKIGDRVVVRTAGGSLCISVAADGEAFMAGGCAGV
ncbi:MAG: hypothetical protein C5S49_04685 [Candidatus Methanogaster sp.]|nr:MAG: hypothetical protein C5S49_04685 [ANME-2 cluster archaeon]